MCLFYFGETHGYDKDQPRPNARGPIGITGSAHSMRTNHTGDSLRWSKSRAMCCTLGTVDGIEALGVLAAGPWDFIGHVEVRPNPKIDGKVGSLPRPRRLRGQHHRYVHGPDRSLCAQCHNHKFDPIAQEDYYRLQAGFRSPLTAPIKRTMPIPKVAAKRPELGGDEEDRNPKDHQELEHERGKRSPVRIS